MKKVKIIFSTLLVILVGAYFICSLVIPEQIATFNSYASVIVNKPITIAGVSITIGGIITFIITKFILANTKFGRKELDNINNNFSECENKVNEFKNAIENKITEYELEVKEFKENCNNQVTILVSEFNDLQQRLLAALKTIPNKKVQAIVEEYEKKFEERKAEIITKVTNTNDYIDTRLKEMFEEFMEKLQNEREETVDSETEEE